jgi:hypothetical protein
MDGMTAEEMLKEARKRMYKQLRATYPNADKQVVKMTAYDLTREAATDLNNRAARDADRMSDDPDEY